MHFSFTLNAVDPSGARQGTFVTPHGPVETPVFMPVGTQGTVKGVTRDHLRDTGATMILGNTYHLALRPGEQLIAKFGGLHKFIGWDKPMLTDSGGFQLFSLAERTRITEHGATFRSHIDGKSFELTPERAVEIQEALGSDVAMLLDHVIGLPATRDKIADAMERTIRWAKRAQLARKRDDQQQFAIVQGGLETDLRIECAMRLTELNFPGYAIGGLSVGEPPVEMYRILDGVCPQLPAHKPRYLMGVGTPIDLLEGIVRGVDMFDCVMPTRNGRNALVFTDAGPVRLRNTQWKEDPNPLEANCPCPACRHSKAYLRHLFQADEMTGPILASLHNLHYYQRITREAREAIRAGRYAEFRAAKIAGWGGAKAVEEASEG